jgi:hypothetical protein
MNYSYVIVTFNQSGPLDVFGPFSSREKAEAWAERTWPVHLKFGWSCRILDNPTHAKKV